MKISSLAACVVVASAWLPSRMEAQMDITRVGILTTEERFSGVLGAGPYGYGITVTGTGILAVQVLTPGGGIALLVNDGEEWGLHGTGFTSFQALSTATDFGFGSFHFVFTGPGGSTDTVTLAYLPASSSTPPHAGYGTVLQPTHGQSGVSLTPSFSWSCTNGPCGSFAWFMETFPTSGAGIAHEANLAPGATTWVPGCLSGNTPYGFWLSSGTLLVGLQPTVTAGGDAFVFEPGFETINQIEFVTEPGSILASVAFRNAGANPASYSAAPAVIGSAWGATVDLATTGHSEAYLFGYSQPAGVVLPGGQTALIGGALVFRLGPSPGPLATFAGSIPPNLALCGARVYSQAVHLGGGAFALSNAQDFLMGF